MIIRPLSRRWGAAQCLAQTCRATPAISSPRFTRNKHTTPSLRNDEQLKANGIPGLFTAKAFDTAWTQYHGYLVKQLNLETAGTEYENQEPKALAIEWARDPEKAHKFNVASMAFNNHFFFKGISSDPDVIPTPPADLLAKIKDSFHSFDSFRESFLNTAEAMFGPGFVWLVQRNDQEDRKLDMVTTYLAGSPLSGAHWRRQSHDLNTENPDSYQKLNAVGAFGSAAKLDKDKKGKMALGGVDLVPLLCVNTWQHVWLNDYGVLGKRDFLEKWWDRIDWNEVRNLGTFTPRSQQKFQY